ncbi:MAG: FAD binding domain-containing protein, partial [Cellulosilyticaceae bacterium]
MFTAKNYAAPTTLEEAYTLLMQNKKNQVMGGMMWMRLGEKNIPTVIDLKNLGLDQIVEHETYIEIGASVTLRAIETSAVLATWFDGILPRCVAHIVGVQFRNSATIGGSVFGKFGFSNISTALLALDTEVVLHHGGVISLEQFLERPFEKDILTHIRIKKEHRKTSYVMHVQSATDLPVLVVATSRVGDAWRVVVGARPSKARLSHGAAELLKAVDQEGQVQEVAQAVVEELNFGTNIRAGQRYREILAKEFVQRTVTDL